MQLLQKLGIFNFTDEFIPNFQLLLYTLFQKSEKKDNGLRLKWDFPNMIRDIYQKPIADITF